MWNFRSPVVRFFYLVKDFFFCQKKKLHLWASKILHNFAALKRKQKKNWLLKEIDGEGEDVDARDRALHREATVELNKFCSIFNVFRK